MSYEVKHTSGAVEDFATYPEAMVAVGLTYAEVVIGHEGDIGHGGHHTLCWPSSEVAQSDPDGSLACCVITMAHVAGVQS